MPGTRALHRGVDDLVERVVGMAALSRLSVHEGVESLVKLDTAAAKRILLMNQEINRADVEIEARALDLLALNQPLATDLRTVGASLKCITYLDRIGRYGYDVAKATLALEGREHERGDGASRSVAAAAVGIPAMRDKALALLDRAILAFRTRDAQLARTVQPGDDEVDAMYDQIFRVCVTHMIEDPRTITECTQYILVARHLERVGDNAGKIAEKTIYMVTGERRLDLDAP